MIDIPLLKVGDVITLKKSHPCGCDKFEILRLGSDIRIKCTSCSKDLDIPREKLEKRIKFIN